MSNGTDQRLQLGGQKGMKASNKGRAREVEVQ